MEFTEERVYEALGVTPKGEGEKEQEPAAPAAQEPQQPDGQEQQPDGEGAEQQPAAQEPEGTADPEGPQGEGDPAQDVTPAGDGKQPQSEEQRKENAALRRRQEQQAAVERAVQNALAQERERSKSEMASFFAKAGLTNTLTGKPITNMQEFEEWSRDFEAAKLQRDLKAGKLTPEGLNKAISDNPTLKRAEEIIQRDEDAKRRNDLAEAKAKIDAELQEIHKLDPAINETADLLKMPNAKEFYDYVRKGNSFLDAFYLANRERLAERTAEAARQQAMSNNRSKEHLNPVGNSRGAGAHSVPAEEMELFKLLNPNATEAEIQTYYNRSRSK